MKIKCKCNGVPIRGYICPAVTIGGKYCKATFKCRYQEKEEETKGENNADAAMEEKQTKE